MGVKEQNYVGYGHFKDIYLDIIRRHVKQFLRTLLKTTKGGNESDQASPSLREPVITVALVRKANQAAIEGKRHARHIEEAASRLPRFTADEILSGMGHAYCCAQSIMKLVVAH